MTDKRYPTRMHEVLGVETGQVFYFEGISGLCQEYVLDAKGHLFRNHKTQRIESPRMMADIINHPERIVRIPRLSEEQVEVLMALLKIDFKWVARDYDGFTFVCEHKPKKRQYSWGCPGSAIVCHNDSPTSFLQDLTFWSDPEPLDIVATLKAAGVGVE